MNRSADPNWFLVVKVIPKSGVSDHSEPTADELAEMGEFVRRLAKCIRRHEFREDPLGLRACLYDLGDELLGLKKHRLRAAYWEHICKMQTDFETDWRMNAWRRQRAREEARCKRY
jgi:hypothetical protein